jgi:dolichol-phosphate mannosyltransferase
MKQTDSSKAKLSIVVAVYNESTYNLHALIERLEKALAPLRTAYEIVFVNDGSKEDTTACLKELVEQLDYAKLINLSRNFGQQAAVSAGINFAAGQAIVTMDSDLQDPPELIPDMVNLWQRGYDVVYAKRSSRKDRLAKRFTAFVFYRLMSSLASIDIPRDIGEFRLIDRRVADCLNELPEHTRYIRGLIPWLGFKQTTIPVDRQARQHGESGYNLRKLIALAFDGLVYFSHAPLYAVLVLGVITMSAALAIFALSLAFLHHPSWIALTVTGFVFLSGLQFLMLGIVGLYIAKIFDEVRARPIYVVSEISGRMLNLGKNKSETRAHELVATLAAEHVLAAEHEFAPGPVSSDFRSRSHFIMGPNTERIL